MKYLERLLNAGFIIDYNVNAGVLNCNRNMIQLSAGGKNLQAAIKDLKELIV